MNKHIELVKKWLADPDSVTKEELDKNLEAADAASWTASCAARAAKADADWADWAASCAASCAARCAAWSAKGDVKRAKHWVERYEELVK